MAMSGIRIRDRMLGRDVLGFDLMDILDAFRAEVEQSEWQVCVVECWGPNADEMEELSRQGNRISGRKLLELAKQIEQVIDGVFRGFKNEDRTPWIILYPVESAFWDVYSTSSQVLAQIVEHFQNVTKAPPEEWLEC